MLNILKKKIGVKLEAAQGSAATLASSDFMLAYDIQQEPVVEMLKKLHATGSFTKLGDRPGKRHRAFSFKFEAKGGGTMLAPHSAILQACNFAETTGANGVLSLAVSAGGTVSATADYSLVALTITGGGGTGAAGYAVVKGGTAVKGIITNPGSGYATAPTVSTTGWDVEATFTPTRGSYSAYGPISAAPSNFVSPAKSVTIEFELDGRKIQLVGCIGNVNIVGKAGDRVTFEANFIGMFAAATDATLTAAPVDYDGPLLGSAPFFLFANAVQVEDFSFSLDAALSMRPATSGVNGIKDFIITDREPKATLNPELETVATLPVESILIAGTHGVCMLEVGAIGTDFIRILAPQAQMGQYKDADRENIATTDLSLMLKKGSIANDQELLLLFA